MHHAPSLLPEFTDFVEDGDVLVVGHHQSDETQGYECSSTAHSGTAVHDGNLSLAEEVEEGIDEDVESLPALLAGDIAIGPIGKLVVAHHSRNVGCRISHL